MDQEKRNKLRSDERLRNNIEGKFGQAKRGFSLVKVMAKLPETSMTA
ncbi:MAG: transposase, partial [Okeania sp. SIO3H1]|nr:transposase [Okeania sp. SIO3H1]